MADRVIKFTFSGDSVPGVRALNDLGSAAERNATKLGAEIEKAGDRVGGVFGKLGGLAGQFGVPFAGVIDTVGSKLTQLETKSSSTFQNIAKAGQGMAIGLGAAAIAVGVESVKMADEFEKSHANLQTAIVNSGHKFSDFSKTIDQQHSSFEKLGYTNAQYEAGLAKLTSATQDPAKAISLMGIAADGAAKQHMSLEEAAQLVGLAAEGNTRKLKMLLPDLNLAGGTAIQVAKAHDTLAKAQENLTLVEEHVHEGRLKGPAAADALRAANERLQAAQDGLTKAQQGGDNALSALGARWDGAASRQAETFHGKIQVLKAQLEDTGVKIGNFLIPILTKLGTIIGSVIGFVTKHREVLIALGLVVGGMLTAGFIAWTASLWAAVTAEGAVLAPALAIIAVIGLIGLAIYELVTHWHDVWNAILSVLNAAWQAISGVFTGAWDWLKGFLAQWWPYILGLFTGGLSLLIGLVVQNWDSITSFIGGALSTIGGLISGAISFISGIWSGFWGGLSSAVSGAWNGAVDLVRGAINTIIGFINHMIDAIDGIQIHIPEVHIPLVGTLGGGTIGFPHIGEIPYLDAGGVVPGPIGLPQLVMAHGGETVYPTHRDRNADRRERAGHNVTVIAHTNADARAIAREVHWQLKTAGT